MPSSSRVAMFSERKTDKHDELLRIRATHRKQLTFYAAVIEINGDGKELVSLEISTPGRDSGAGSVNAAVWIHKDNTRKYGRSGSARAGGHGYHKASAAFEQACNNMGVTFDITCEGCGQEAMLDALRAIGEALTLSPVFVTHGGSC